ncbi:MAG: glycoside hydrolase family 3 N-terminal domain-containing protein [Bacteroidia bacterium]
MKRYLSLTIFIVFVSVFFNAGNLPYKHRFVKEALLVQKHFLEENNYPWADSVFTSLSSDERIAQLFMVAAYSNKDQAHVNEISKLVKDYHIGGLIFFQGGPSREAILTNKYQKMAKVPLMISIDGEWGLAMRLDSTISFPKQMTLGAIQNDSLIYEMGKEIALQCKRIGIHVNLAPVVDVNNNPNNPVINYRSFGENKYNVARKGIMYMKGMQDVRVMANAKHFPGHGDTDTDSHLALPVINHSKARIDSLELYPFKEMMKAGLGSVMVAHLFIPSLDDTPKQATTLSPKVVNGLLKEEMQFKGLAFTDALNMKGVSSFYQPGEVDLKALLAGNDVLLFAEDVPKAISYIKTAVKEGKVSQKEIDQRALKILKAKEWLGLHNQQEIKLDSIYEDLNNEQAERINRKLYREALTLIKNDKQLVPLKRLDTLKIATVNIGYSKASLFTQTVEKYANATHFYLSKNANEEELAALKSKLANYNTILVALADMNQRPKSDFGVNTAVANFISEVSQQHNTVLSVFGNPYALKKLPTLTNATSIIIAYEEKSYTEEFVPQLIFGGVAASGKLPVSISNIYPEGHGIVTEKTRVSYVDPKDLGIKKKHLKRIDSLVEASIKDSVFPGCQILAMKDGQVFFQKSYGHHTYDEATKVENHHLYDLASITKIAASTASLMKLQEEGLVNVDSTLKTYLADVLDSSEYGNINIKEMLAHQAGLTAWIPFYTKTLKLMKPNPVFYSAVKKENYSTQVAENLYILDSYKDSIFDRILDTSLSSKKKYKYSDLGYYFLKEILERNTNVSLNYLADSLFYKPMGLRTMGYLPLNRFSKNDITPTENDKTFRGQLIHGYVHDQGAAMLGGVGGHAGLFSNANDLGVFMYMLSKYGVYGGERYLEEKTVKYFTKAHFTSNDNRRGIGFDKPVRSGKGGPTCEGCASLNSFGHSGFTGTIVWADPDKGLVFVFLSNRVNPSAENNKLIKNGVRTYIQQWLYDAISDTKEKDKL